MPDWNLLVENYYKKNRPDKWGRDAIDKLILEMLREEEEQEDKNEDPDYSAATDPKTVEWFLDFLRKNGYENATVAGLVGGNNPRVQITNLGSDRQRLKIADLVAKAGKEYEQDSGKKGYKKIKIGNQVFDLIQGSAKVSAEGEEACMVMDSTAFEGNIIYGILYLSAGEKAAEAFLAQAKNVKKGIVCDPDALKQGIAAGKKLLPQIEGAGLDAANTRSTSGGKVKASLTDAYKGHGVKSTEAKADIAIGDMGVSVKKYEDSQFVSAQGPELAAIFDVAMKYIAKDASAEVTQAIDKFTDGLERATGSGEKAHAVNPETGEREKGQADFYGVRDKMSGTKTTKKGETKVDNTPYQKLLNKFLNLDNVEDVSDGEKQQLRAAFADTTADGFVELRENVRDIISDNKFKAALCKEAITGEFKFNEDLPKATGILKWSTKDASKADFLPLVVKGKWNDGWFQQVASGAKLEIRDRGSGRGGSLRGEFGKESLESDLPLLTEDFSANDLAEIDARTEVIYQRMMSNQLLQEGFMDKIGSALSKGKDWVKGAVGKITKAIAGMVSKMTQWFKNMLNKGVSYVLQFLGIEPVSLEVSF
tara:strand:- start:3404 stop:5182 length:1779 start_codon:yes stop_codon:yes gene_type:complete